MKQVEYRVLEAGTAEALGRVVTQFLRSNRGNCDLVGGVFRTRGGNYMQAVLLFTGGEVEGPPPERKT